MTYHDLGRSLNHYYDNHVINEDLILQRLRNQGICLETLSEEVLKDYDMDYLEGAAAVKVLVQKAGIRPTSYVLDVCSGLGGPARYLAHRHGCRVMGLDITESRYHSALRLTRLVQLDHLVDFRLGNALEMPFAPGTFDVVIGQEAWVHIPDKARLLAECARVLKEGGTIAFTDFLHGDAITPAEAETLQRFRGGPWFGESLEGYSRLLAEAGFTLLEREYLGQRWTKVFSQMAKERQEAGRQFGGDSYRHQDEQRRFMLSLFSAGTLGGGRFIARRNAAGPEAGS